MCGAAAATAPGPSHPGPTATPGRRRTSSREAMLREPRRRLMTSTSRVMALTWSAFFLHEVWVMGWRQALQVLDGRLRRSVATAAALVCHISSVVRGAC